MNICRRIGAAILSAAVAVGLGLTAVPTAQASFDSSGPGDINVRIHFNPGGYEFDTETSEIGVQRQGYRLYRIATISEDGNTFKYGDEYKDLPGRYVSNSLTPKNAYEVLMGDYSYVQRIGTYINQNHPEPYLAAPFVSNVATFVGLEPGLYLGTGPSANFGGKTYTPVPFVICLPYKPTSQDVVPTGSGAQAGIEYSDLDITVKPVTYTPSSRRDPPPPDNPPPDNPPPDNPPPDEPPTDNPPPDEPPPVDIPDEPVPLVDIPDEPTPLVEIPDEPTPQSPATPPKTTTTTPNKPKLPQTGALWWPVPVMGGSGAVLMCAGLVGRRKSK